MESKINLVEEQSNFSKILCKMLDIISHNRFMSLFEMGLKVQKFYSVSRWKVPKNYTMKKIDLPSCSAELLMKHGTKTENLIIQLHGGVYILDLIDPYRDMAVNYANISNVNVLSVDYRTAPENVYPCALEDALSAWNYALENGYKAENIILAGDSAGGNLTLALTMKLREINSEIMPRALVLMSPWTDMSFSLPSNNRNNVKDVLFGKQKETDASRVPRSPVFDYAGDMDLKDPLLSPCFGEFHNFPPMLIQVGTHEILEDDSFTIYEKAIKENVPVQFTRYEGMFHVFQLVPILLESKKAWKEVQEFISNIFYKK